MTADGFVCDDCGGTVRTYSHRCGVCYARTVGYSTTPLDAGIAADWTRQEQVVLDALSRLEWGTVSVLSRETLYPPYQVRRALHRLAVRGLVHRRPGPTGRDVWMRAPQAVPS